jgi:hypothetical protein
MQCEGSLDGAQHTETLWGYPMGFASTSLGVFKRKERKRIQKRKDCGTDVQAFLL